MIACRLASNKSGTKVGYFAMVTMETVEVAAKCIQSLHQSRFKGVKITVKKVSYALGDTGFGPTWGPSNFFQILPTERGIFPIFFITKFKVNVGVKGNIISC